MSSVIRSVHRCILQQCYKIKGKRSGRDRPRTSEEGGIGVCGIAVLANFSCGISVILILNCGIAVFSKPAGCVFLAFWSTIVGIKTQP